MNLPGDDPLRDWNPALAIGLKEAAKLMRGRGGRPPHVKTVRIWADPDQGCYPRGRDGPRIVLMSLRLNGDLITMPAWVQAFEEARVRAGQRPVSTALPERTSKKRLASHKRAEAELDRAGVRDLPGPKRPPRGKARLHAARNGTPPSDTQGSASTS